MAKVYATLDVGGTPCPVTNMFDIAGDATDDLDMACSVVVALPDGRWLSIQVDGEELDYLQ